MVYLVGVASPHVAIGTAAVAVAVNAAANLASHARGGAVKWRCASVFAAAGVVGAYGGSTLGKLAFGDKLLALLAVLMVIVAGLMLRKRAIGGDKGVHLNRENLPWLLATGLTAGGLSGCFKREAFGIVTDIHVGDTLKKKLDVDFRNYRVLGACNPALALCVFADALTYLTAGITFRRSASQAIIQR